MIFGQEGINPLRVRVLTDESGKTKGAAFVDFATPEDSERACRMDGRQLPGINPRGLKVNPANSKPGGR